MRVFINASGASAGGGLTYLRNLLPHLAENRDVTVIALVREVARGVLSPGPNVDILTSCMEDRGTLSRFWWEQTEIPRLIRATGSDVLLSTGNFAIWNSPVPQLLLSRNSLYTSSDFTRDLFRRGAYRMWVDTRLRGFLAKKSIHRAELTVAPSEAFARELRTWSGRDVVALHHGFDKEFFVREKEGLSPAILEKLADSEGAVRLLFVSHYNYYRNIETLLRAVALFKQREPSRRLRLLLTCELAPGKNPGGYQTANASGLLQELQIADEVVQLGAIPYPQLHNIYRASDIYVTTAYTESFAHPLVEAMACGLPVVASDLDVHHEITGGAALFFEKFSPASLVDQVEHLLDCPAHAALLRERGFEQSEKFSWKSHVERLLELAISLTQTG